MNGWSGRQAARAVRADQVVVDHRAQIVFGKRSILHDFVRGAKAVEEVDEWHA